MQSYRFILYGCNHSPLTVLLGRLPVCRGDSSAVTGMFIAFAIGEERGRHWHHVLPTLPLR